MISEKNIIVSALEEFHCNEYEDSIYLWEGAKHELTLTEIFQSKIATHQDLYITQEKIDEGFNLCRNIYYQVLSLLAQKMNSIHNLNYSESFWQVVFGYWLHRHISIIYDKYIYLCGVDIDNCGIKVLNKDDYYIPTSHFDYMLCFADDFGVQQLVSQYCHLFSNKDFSQVKKKNPKIYKNNYQPPPNRGELDPQIALLDVFFSQKVISNLFEKSQGQVGNIFLPVVPDFDDKIDYSKRKLLSETATKNDFEKYFFESLFYCMPKEFIERFPRYHTIFREDIEKKRFTHIVSESWISNIQVAIYIAIAREKKRTFILNEHGYGTFFFKKHITYYVDYDAADVYLTIGWKKNGPKYVHGGLTCRDLKMYEYDNTNETILYIAHTKNLYWLEYQEYTSNNSAYIHKMKIMDEFINLLPSGINNRFIFRPRRGEFFWNTAAALNLKNRGISIDDKPLEISIQKARIVVIDHIGTALAELLIMKAPFIFILEYESITFPEEFVPICRELVNCGVLHSNAKSAISQLEKVYSDVAKWWNSETVQAAIQHLIGISLAPESKTTDYLLSLIKTEKSDGLSNEIVMHERISNNKYSEYKNCTELRDKKEKNNSDLLSLAERLIILNDLSEAKNILLTLEKRNYETALVQNNLALIYIYEGKYYEAEKNLKTLLKHDDNYSTAIENLVYLNLMRNSVEDPSEPINLNESLAISEVLISENRFVEAENILFQVLDKNYKNIDALINLSTIRILEEEFAEAEYLLNEILRLEPENEVAVNNLNYISELNSDGTSNIKSNPVFGCIDPVFENEISGVKFVTFWMLKDFPEEPIVHVYVDNKKIWNLERYSRLDVINAFPDHLVNNPHAGCCIWLPTQIYGNGEHKMRCFAFHKNKVIQFAEAKFVISN
jgi:putative transferase (TIGR04331 family)